MFHYSRFRHDTDLFSGLMMLTMMRDYLFFIVFAAAATDSRFRYLMPRHFSMPPHYLIIIRWSTNGNSRHGVTAG